MVGLRQRDIGGPGPQALHPLDGDGFGEAADVRQLPGKAIRLVIAKGAFLVGDDQERLDAGQAAYYIDDTDRLAEWQLQGIVVATGGQDAPERLHFAVADLLIGQALAGV